MNPETTIQNETADTQKTDKAKHIKRLKIFAAALTVPGIALFSYFIYSVGVWEILFGIGKIGFGGFALILFLYFLRLVARAVAWQLSINEPYELKISDTLPAIIIGEALSSLIPLGILVSGTSKAVAVRNRVPLVVGLSSIATENLFYSFMTGIFIVLGAFAFLRSFDLPDAWIVTIDLLIFAVLALIVLGLAIIIRQWHLASSFCEWLYNRHVLRSILENGRRDVKQFEDFIFEFYRKYPRRFLPIALLQIVFHALGVAEVFFVLSRLSDAVPTVYSSFLLESMSRVITVVFKLIPFLIGVDEAGAQFVADTLALGAGIGVTLAIIRKGRILFWTALGMLLIFKREISLLELLRHDEQANEKS